MLLTPEESRRINEEAKAQEQSKQEARRELSGKRVSKAHSQWLADITRTRLMIIKVLVGLIGLIIFFGILGHTGQNHYEEATRSFYDGKLPSTVPAPATPTVTPTLKSYLTEAYNVPKNSDSGLRW